MARRLPAVLRVRLTQVKSLLPRKVSCELLDAYQDSKSLLPARCIVFLPRCSRRFDQDLETSVLACLRVPGVPLFVQKTVKRKGLAVYAYPQRL